MRFRETSLPGAYVIEIEANADERGFFARTWCTREFAAHGLPATMLQTSISHNLRRGTVRGVHLQLPPSREGKLVRCTQGAIYDAIVDLRRGSNTFLRHFAIELRADQHNALYIPPSFAHGFQTLVDGTEVLYQMTDFYESRLQFGARWDDPAFGIEWPIRTGCTIIERDATCPDFNTEQFLELAARAGAS